MRVPLIPGHNDGIDQIEAVYRLATEYGIDRVHLLPYNSSAAAKYEWLDRRYEPGELQRQDASYLDTLRRTAPAPLAVEVL